MGVAAGERIGPYKIVSSLGCGGLAEVYRARDTESGTEVAIKLLREEVAADSDERRRLDARHAPKAHCNIRTYWPVTVQANGMADPTW